MALGLCTQIAVTLEECLASRNLTLSLCEIEESKKQWNGSVITRLTMKGCVNAWTERDQRLIDSFIEAMGIKLC